MKQALAMATAWARERRQWDAAIGEHEAVAGRLAGMAARFEEIAADRAVTAWCLYDWANSAFATVVLSAVLPVYFAAIARGPVALAHLSSRVPAASASSSGDMRPNVRGNRHAAA